LLFRNVAASWKNNNVAASRKSEEVTDIDDDDDNNHYLLKTLPRIWNVPFSLKEEVKI
jgi:hypothetical protein